MALSKKQKERELMALESRLSTKYDQICDKIEKDAYEKVFAETNDITAAKKAANEAYSDAYFKAKEDKAAELAEILKAQDAEEKAEKLARKQKDTEEAKKRREEYDAQLKAERLAQTQFQVEENKKFWSKMGL